MKIEVIGPGCPFCRKLYKDVSEVCTENNIAADIRHVTEFSVWIKYFPRTPVLIVDDNVRHRGKFLPKKPKIKELLGI